jgi:hypothetical protein
MTKDILTLGLAQIKELHKAQEALDTAGFNLDEDNILYKAEDTILKMLEIAYEDDMCLIGDFIYETNFGEVVGKDDFKITFGDNHTIHIIDEASLYEALTYDYPFINVTDEQWVDDFPYEDCEDQRAECADNEECPFCDPTVDEEPTVHSDDCTCPDCVRKLQKQINTTIDRLMETFWF